MVLVVSSESTSMRRVILWLLPTVTVLVLLFGYRTSNGGNAAANTYVATPSPTPTADEAGPPGNGAVSGTFTGAAANTVRGPIRVRVTLVNGAITAVDVPVHPSGHPRDRELNGYALPLLEQEAVAAQSANIDTVSGATVTSKGYQQSLQSALDAAHGS
jgi:uncharacterized protein with FMN-binding domain